jgi:hypothetical protein
MRGGQASRNLEFGGELIRGELILDFRLRTRSRQKIFIPLRHFGCWRPTSPKVRLPGSFLVEKGSSSKPSTRVLY